MYHYDPSTALEELREDATLPNPVHLRDMILRKVAAKRGIHVPSLVADALVVEKATDEHVLEDAVEHEAVLADVITCPTCGEHVPLEQALHHEHFTRPVEYLEEEPTNGHGRRRTVGTGGGA